MTGARSRARAVRYALAGALSSLARHPRHTALAALALAAALVGVGACRIASREIDGVAHSWGRGVHMVVYLQPGVSSRRAARIAGALGDIAAVDHVSYVSPADALARLRASLGKDAAALADAAPSLMPASLEVSLSGDVAEVAAARPIARRLESIPGVARVTFPGAWVDRASAAITGLRILAWLALAVAAAACLYLACVVMGARSGARRSGAVLRLVGASAAFVRSRTVAEGGAVGAVAGVVAVLALWALYAAFGGAVDGFLARGFGAAPLAFLAPAEVAALVVGGALVGAVGAAFASPGPERG